MQSHCINCGECHDYTPEECGNFLTFGQGGADFKESQRLAKLYDEECADSERKHSGVESMSDQTPISKLLHEVVDRIESGEFDDKSLAERSDLLGLRASLIHHLRRVEEIERPVPVEVEGNATGEESRFKVREFGDGVEVNGKRLSATFYEAEGGTQFRLTTEGPNKIRVVEQGADFIALGIAKA